MEYNIKLTEIILIICLIIIYILVVISLCKRLNKINSIQKEIDYYEILIKQENEKIS